MKTGTHFVHLTTTNMVRGSEAENHNGQEILNKVHENIILLSLVDIIMLVITSTQYCL